MLDETGQGESVTTPYSDWVEIRVDDQLGPGGRVQMRTEAKITCDGQLLVTSSGTNPTNMDGHLGLIILLYGPGQHPEWIWNTHPIRFGLDTARGNWDRITVSFAQGIPLDILACARYIAVRQFLSRSREVWTDIKPWLAAAQAPTRGFDVIRDRAQPLQRSPRTFGSSPNWTLPRLDMA